MDYLEEVMKYLIGTEIGIIDIEDFSNFIDSEIVRLENIPDIYIEVSLNINKGIRKLGNVVSDYCFDNRISLTEKQTNRIKKYLLTIIENKYSNKEINMKQCVHFMYELSLNFNDLSELNSIEDYYNLAMQGICYTLEDVENKIKQIFKENNII